MFMLVNCSHCRTRCSCRREPNPSDALCARPSRPRHAPPPPSEPPVPPYPYSHAPSGPPPNAHGRKKAVIVGYLEQPDISGCAAVSLDYDQPRHGGLPPEPK
ncbi:metacaspase-1 [Striga asiatica]|uniref:Metacaspase-1 n=1 Tax=Striga asiatica TaxID=4170 RepID=A0A5A7QD86_STRAF|nr:metacaspase-1 [Striga asiatica]